MPTSRVARLVGFLVERGRWVVFLLTALLGLGLDLGTKEWAFSHPSLVPENSGRKIELVAGWLDFQLSTNKGSAFGLFAGQHAFFLAISAIAFVAIFYFVHVAPRSARLGPAVLGLVLAGVLGNFWDRCVHVEVRDFILCHTPPAGVAFTICMKIFKSSTWPTFNVADAFICVGAFAIVIALWREDKAKAAKKIPDEPKPAPSTSVEPPAAPQGATP